MSSVHYNGSGDEGKTERTQHIFNALHIGKQLPINLPCPYDGTSDWW